MPLANIHIINSDTLKPQHVQYFQHYDHNTRECHKWYATRSLKLDERDVFMQTNQCTKATSITKGNCVYSSLKDLIALNKEDDLLEVLVSIRGYLLDLTFRFRMHKNPWRKRMMARYDRKMRGER